MPGLTNPALAQAVSDMIDAWRLREQEMQDWIAGAANGGPFADGRFPLTDYLGVVRYTYSPAALEAGVEVSSDAAAASAVEAADSAVDAATAQTAAETARNLALTYQTGAQTARDLAELYRDQAANSEANALVHAGNAEDSATASAGSASDANTSAIAAAASAVAADGSADAAAASAAAAAASAIEAATFDPDLYGALAQDETVTGNWNFTGTLSKSGTAVSLVGHTHAAANITSGEFDKLRVRDMQIADTRTVDSVPSTYGQQVRFDFKDSVSIGGPTGSGYFGLMTVAPWTYSGGGGPHHQLAFTQSNEAIYHRVGNHSTDVWKSWNKLALTGVDETVTGLWTFSTCPANSGGVAEAATASTLVRRNSSGYIFATYFNQNSGNSENPTVSQIIVTNGGDNYTRMADLAHVSRALFKGSGNAAITVSTSAASGTPADGDLWIQRAA